MRDKMFRILAVLFVIATAAPAGIAGAADGLENVRSAVEKSALPRDAKDRLLATTRRAASAGISTEDVTVIVTRGLERGIEGRDIEGFLETATRTKEQRLPVRLVLDRIEQGLAKGVPAERISGVTQQLAGHLAAAQPIVSDLEKRGVRSTGAKEPEDAVETVARALEQSVPRDAVMGIGENVKDRKGSLALFNGAVDAMTTFAGSGMPGGQAANMVSSALGKGYSERDLEAMARYMVNELRKNRSMSDVVSSMNSRLERGEAMRDTHDMPGREGGGPMREPGPGGMGGMPGMGGRR